MTTRRAALGVLAAAIVAGCSAPERPTPTHTPTAPTSPNTPAPSSTPPTTPPAQPHPDATEQGVTPGAYCDRAGAHGRTNRGTAMRCTQRPGDRRPRWRAA